VEIEGRLYADRAAVSILIKNGLIKKITRINAFKNRQFKEFIIAPGFIDNQINGYLSYDFSRNDLTVDKIERITKKLWEQGVTTYLPTLISESRERLTENFRILAQARKNPDIKQSIPGFHLEGPYLSPLDGYRGAHNVKYVRKPDWREFMEWYEASEENIIEVSLAPEIEGALEFISKLRQKGIVVALAHHNADAEVVKKAVDAGARISTHLGNACANRISRHYNPIWPQLADDRLMASIIVDGLHLTPEEVRVFYKVKGPFNTILVSDLSSLAGMPPGEYERFGQKVVVQPNGMISLPSQNVLAAASFMISKGIENMLRFTGCTLAQAVNLASRNPARLLGLTDRGEIKKGLRADLVLFEMSNHQIEIQKTIVGGRVVFDKSE